MGTPAASERDLLGSYEIVNRLADQEGELYVARPQGGGSEVVLLVVDVDEAKVARFLQEVARAQTVGSSAMARVIEIFDDWGRQVIVYEPLHGTSLRALWSDAHTHHERIGDCAVLSMAIALLELLAEAHRLSEGGNLAPLLHPQLGPHQVVISWDGEIKVLGFGLGDALDVRASGWLQPFVAPEVVAGGSLSRQANVFSVGAMLWTLLSGEALPTDGASPPPLRRIRPDLPASLTFPIDRALAPADKRIGAKALAVGLRRALGSLKPERMAEAMQACRARSSGQGEFLQSASSPSEGSRVLESVAPASSDLFDSEAPTALHRRSRLLSGARAIENASLGTGGPVGQESSEGRASAVERDASAEVGEDPQQVGPGIGDTVDMGGELPGSGLDASPESRSAVESTLRAPASEPAPGPSIAEPETFQDSFVAEPPTSREPHATIPMALGGSESPSASERPRIAPISISALPTLTPDPLSGGQHAPLTPRSPVAEAAAGREAEALARGAARVPAKWVMAVALTAVLSFAAGLLVASGGMEVRVAPAEPTVSKAAAAQPSAPPSASFIARHHPRAESRSGRAAKPRRKAGAAMPAAPLPAPKAAGGGRGKLLVQSTIQGAFVYLNGRLIGPVGQTLDVVCGLRFLRLGTSPLGRWFEPGRSARVACGSLTKMRVERSYPTSTRRRAGRQFLP